MGEEVVKEEFCMVIIVLKNKYNKWDKAFVKAW